GMRQHPLTPMLDANLVRVLQAQCRRSVGLIRHDVVAQGEAAVRTRIDALRGQAVPIAVADAIDNADLRVLAAACADLALLTAGSGLALGLPEAYAARGWLTPDAHAATLDIARGSAAVLAGSCSLATQAQVQHWQQAGRPAFAIDPRALARGEPVAAHALAWSQSHLPNTAVLVFATASAQALSEVQGELGAMHAGALVEACLAEIARGLVDVGVRRLVVAGGETSGAVVQALGVTQLRIGPSICPGVPWTQAEGADAKSPLHLALKSGNFGGPAFFDEALNSDPSA
ncbi:MAG: 3-oxo-tetronate kinase, partial [Burkholderiaceae bacterium]